jgi:hypothetical protein
MPDPPVVNEAVRLDGEFRDNARALVDVAGLSVLVRMPDASNTTYSGGAVVHDSLGLYHANHVATLVGTHNVRWLDSGNRVVLEYEFYVAESAFDAPEDWQPITAAEVEAQSQVDFEALGLAPRRLQTAVEASKAWVEWVTGRPMDPTLPTSLMPLGREAVRQRVELMAYRESSDAVQTAGTEGIASMSVGGLSLSFRDPGARAAQTGGAIGAAPAITPWSVLNENLWALMTDERRDWWMGNFLAGGNPHFAVTEPDFSWPSESSHGVRTSDFPWEPFGGGPPGWPGWGWD